MPASRNSGGNRDHLLRIDSPALAALFDAGFQRNVGGRPRRRRLNKADSGPSARSKRRAIRIGGQHAGGGPLFSPTACRDSRERPGFFWSKRLPRPPATWDMALFVFSAQGSGRPSWPFSIKPGDGESVWLADPGIRQPARFPGRCSPARRRPARPSLQDRNETPHGHEPLQGVGTPKLARGDKMHHKFAVIDARR